MADFVAKVGGEIGDELYKRRCAPFWPLAPAGAAAVTLWY
jgi:hypothetical protein